MPEMTDAGEDHGHLAFIGCGDHLFVPNGAAGLDRAGGARIGRGDQAVGEGKKCIACHGAAF